MKHATLLASIGAIALCVGGAASAPLGGGDFEIVSFTIDGGGGTSSGGGFELSGAIGQPDAGPLSGDVFDVLGGFWVRVASASPPCPGDLDGSGAVDFGDILAILSAWGDAGGPEDLDGSGFVDFGDLLVVLGTWGVCP